MLAARWASAWVEKSLQRPLLVVEATGASECFFFAALDAFVAVVVVLDASALPLFAGAVLPQAAKSSRLAAAKPASEGALILDLERFKAASTLCQPVYCGGGGSLRKA